MAKIDHDQLKNIAGGTPGNEDLEVTPGIASLRESRAGIGGGSGGGGGQGSGAETPEGGGGIGDTPQNQNLG